MNVETEKWVRTESGVIRKQTKTHNYPEYLKFKVANTPQELIEVGDIIFEDDLEPILFSEEDFEYEYNIVEIWTKTSENTYTRQWEHNE